MQIMFPMKIRKFFKGDTFESDPIFVTFKSVMLEIFRKCSESVNFDANNDLQEDLKIFLFSYKTLLTSSPTLSMIFKNNFKSDTFENYKSFVPAEVF